MVVTENQDYGFCPFNKGPFLKISVVILMCPSLKKNLEKC